MPKPISTTINIRDNATATLNNISKGLEKCISGFVRLNQVSSSTIDAGIFSACDNALNSINNNVEQIAQNMNNASVATENFSNKLNVAASGSSKLLSTVKRVAGAYLTLQAAGKVIETSDMVSQAKQRLSLTLREGETVEEMNKKIMASANSARASYSDTLNQVSKLAMNAGDSFGNTDQIVKFVEEFNKLGTLGGASVYESSQAMYQLTQSMAKGKLDGDELRSVLEGMPLVSQTIADYLDTDVGTMKEMAAQGQVTADIVRNALLGASEDTDAQFEQLPLTWAQQWQIFKNNAIAAFEPVLTRINEFANNTKVQGFINGLVNGMHVVSGAVMVVFNILSSLFGFIYDNWSILSPIIYGVIAGLAIYGTRLAIIKAQELASAAAKGIVAVAQGIHAAAIKVTTKATWEQAKAQLGLNGAMYSSPIVWIIALIIALVAAIFVVVAIINKVTGSAISAAGVICGVFAVVGAAFWNALLGIKNFLISIGVEIYNLIATFANFFANVFNDPVGAIIELFAGMFDFILGIVQSAAKLIDTVLGSDMSGAVAGFRDFVTDKVSDVVGEQKVVMEKKNASDYLLDDRIKYKNAWKTGYGFGENLKLSFGKDDDKGLDDYINDGGDIPGTLDNIADNTGQIAKDIDISQEDLKYLRDIAEQEAINKFTTAKITVEMNNNNNINNDMDLDGIVDHLATRVTEAMEVAAAGSY